MNEKKVSLHRNRVRTLNTQGVSGDFIHMSIGDGAVLGCQRVGVGGGVIEKLSMSNIRFCMNEQNPQNHHEMQAAVHLKVFLNYL